MLARIGFNRFGEQKVTMCHPWPDEEIVSYQRDGCIGQGYAFPEIPIRAIPCLFASIAR